MNNAVKNDIHGLFIKMMSDNRGENKDINHDNIGVIAILERKLG